VWCGVIIVHPPPRKIPRTIKNTKENDETVCKPDNEEVLTHSSCSAIESTISTHGQNRKCFL
jgi:ribosome production factor 1